MVMSASISNQVRNRTIDSVFGGKSPFSKEYDFSKQAVADTLDYTTGSLWQMQTKASTL
jgi:hypothetical protein